MYGEEVQPRGFNVTVPYIDIDRELHNYIIKKYIKLVLPEITGTLLLALGSGGLALLFPGTMRIIMAVVAVLFLIGFFWNLSGLFEILAKKYECALVEVKKIWDDNGVLMFRIAPDIYRKLDYTDEVVLKRHTKNYKEVKENSEVIVVEGKHIMYLYLFDYDGVKVVKENKNITVKTNTQYMPSKVYRDEFMSQRIVEHPYFGTLAFDIGEDEIIIKMYGIWEDHEGNTPFGGCIETVIRCKSDTVEYHIG